MSELAKTFNPKETQESITLIWQDRFKADAFSPKTPYSILLPPPNVTGQLHMGHACDASIQDALIRYHRMKGYEVAWFPGTDHAGIATQTVVERMLMQTEGKRRVDCTKEEFLAYAHKWKDEYEEKIINQLKRLGVSCDWSRKRFTMDEVSSKTVQTAFKKLFDEGLIYRDLYLVHWDPVTETALADDELEYEEKEEELYFIRFPLAHQPKDIVIATTRPETLLADVAVAVHPEDERYRAFVGHKLLHPLLKKEIPLIADPFVIQEFGSGAVKITPGHDLRDYQVAKRHQLPLVNMMTPSGTVSRDYPEYQDLPLLEARKKIVQRMEQEGFLIKRQPHIHSVAFSYRSKARIEPFLSKQWFLKTSKFKDYLKQIVDEGEVELIPSHWEKTYHHWIDHLHDWCISRQLWWGHEIPVWYDKENEESMICSIGEEIPLQVLKEPNRYRKETDVLDTWFSAALWPLCTTRWIEDHADFSTFFPTSLLVTGHDILFFWVTKMLFMSHYFTGKLPFKRIFLHGLIFSKSYWRETAGSITYLPREEKHKLDASGILPKGIHSKWEKMSKSKGNVIDPLEMIEMYGVDALRFTLLSLVNHSLQIDLDPRKFEEGRNFTNKIWNAFRFAWTHLSPLTSTPIPDTTFFHLEDYWMESRLAWLVDKLEYSFEKMQFDLLTLSLYQCFWDDFCSVYLEVIKPYLFGKWGTKEEQENKRALLFQFLKQLLLLMHPILPFISEELYQRLALHFSLEEPLAAFASYPSFEKRSDGAPFEVILEVVKAVRHMRAEMKIPLGSTPPLYIDLPSSNYLFTLFEKNGSTLCTLAKIGSVHLGPTPKGLELEKCLVRDFWIYLPKEQETRSPISAKERERIEKQLDEIACRLMDPEFTQKAPEKVVEKQRQLQKQLLLQLEQIK